jgi:hypothetical protein
MSTTLTLLQTGLRRFRDYLDDSRFNTRMVAQLMEDADYRRTDHDLDAIRTRFERSPMWPASGVMGERR